MKWDILNNTKIETNTISDLYVYALKNYSKHYPVKRNSIYKEEKRWFRIVDTYRLTEVLLTNFANYTEMSNVVNKLKRLFNVVDTVLYTEGKCIVRNNVFEGNLQIIYKKSVRPEFCEYGYK